MRILAVVKRIIQQMLRDKRSLALMMVAPLLILTLLHYLFASDTTIPKLGVLDTDASVINELKDKDIIIKEYEHVKNKEQVILEEELDGLLQFKDEKVDLTLTNADPASTKALQMKILQAIATENAGKQAKGLAELIGNLQDQLPNVPANIGQMKEPDMNISYIYGDQDTTFFEQLSPILVGFFVFFFVFLISGIALLRERTTGTLERLMATPIQRRDLVIGYLLGYGIFAVIQTLIVVFYAVKVLDIMLAGALGNVILINLCLALVALSLGILLSSFANSEFQMMQFIPIAIIPQVFFAGILPVNQMADWLQVIAKCMPMYYGGNALVGVMYKGLGLSDIRNDLLILLGFALIFIILNVVALRKYRKI
ncbi:ABC transporter permease [Lederbergia galactosidilytica]|uniref:ABC transporter permease n=1 Tax=Lederbergia galactosidilytica TaxID=217031 RepID=A0A177ZIP6_9BACI|nr:ABC transporter permease [Lederbergia galactosidilytica]MBP1914198.1 ABC-2 type transport system permease protein [Lederbergia galactosidilytica]OAK67349.1 ABC transporter permease [Lederbergia galactosidilytica]